MPLVLSSGFDKYDVETLRMYEEGMAKMLRKLTSVFKKTKGQKSRAMKIQYEGILISARRSELQRERKEAFPAPFVASRAS